MDNSKKLIVAAILMVFAAGFSACDRTGPEPETEGEAQGPAEQAGEFIDDSTITAEVKSAILAEPDLSAFQIDVDTTQGVVTLSGSVDSQQDIDNAEQIASSVNGVRSVDNQLTAMANQ